MNAKKFNSKYETDKDEMEKYIHSLFAKLESNPDAQILHNGFYLWCSREIFNPEILFIGINPGNGDKNLKKKVDFEPGKSHDYGDYLQNDYRFDLAEETCAVFELAGMNRNKQIDFFNNNTVKINLYSIVTNNAKDIDRCLNIIGSNKEFKTRSVDFMWSLIEALSPKIIVAEGTGVFYKILDALRWDEIDKTEETVWQEGVGEFTILKSGIPVIGYQRLFSRITNKEGLAKLLKPRIKVI